MSRTWALSLIVLLAGVQAVSAADLPVTVSPGQEETVVSIESRCPTFSWGAASGAKGYDVIVYRIGAEGEETKPVLHQRFDGSVSGWTPSLDDCLDRGGRYAWSARVIGRRSASDWSPARLFAVSDAPSLAEVEEAMAVLRRYRKRADRQEASVAVESAADARSSTRQLGGQLPKRNEPSRALSTGTIGLSAGQATYGLGDVTVSAAPTLSTTPSLSVDNQIHLGAASDIFKGGESFLWSEVSNTGIGKFALSSNTTGLQNTAIGVRALYSNTKGFDNTALGAYALRENIGPDIWGIRYGSGNTALGAYALSASRFGYRNTAVGLKALHKNDGGFFHEASFNTATGAHALYSNTSGSFNIATGAYALYSNTSGDGNIAIGTRAGHFVSEGGYNIHIGSLGEDGDTETIRIGTLGKQTRTFVAGVNAAIFENGASVIIDKDTGQLGFSTSSRRYKEEIADMFDASDQLLALRPVTFRYKKELKDGKRQLQFGLIAEEVAEIFPQLVVYDEEGRPETVKYHLLSTLLVNELQKQARTTEELEKRLAQLEASARGAPGGG